MHATGASCDVVVVGAGIAGLSAAAAIANAGRTVIVLEARERVGGRTFDVPLAACYGATPRTEMGGQFVGYGHHRIRRLVRELGLATFPTFDAGRHVLELSGRITAYRGPVPPLSPRILAGAAMLHAQLYRRARRLPRGSPWLADGAMDMLTVAQWLQRRRTSATGRTFIRLVVEGLLAAEPEQVSLLHLLHYIRSSGGLLALAKIKGGAQQDRVVGGTQQISERLACGLGDAVRLNAAAVRIEWSPDSVSVSTQQGTRIHAARAIVATPPSQLRKIAFEPALPCDRQRLMESLPHGDVIKIAVVYPNPWWRGTGLSGHSVSDRSLAPVVFDNTPSVGEPGVLMILVGGASAASLRALPASERRPAIHAALARAFGPRAHDSVAYIEHDWTEDRWTQGCYGAFAPPGVWSRYGAALRQPVGAVHWAGTETARDAAGYMEGAVESGQRVAGEVLATTRSPSVTERLPSHPPGRADEFAPRIVRLLIKGSICA